MYKMCMNLISNPNHHLYSNITTNHIKIRKVVIFISTCFLPFFNCRMLKNIYCINSYQICNGTSTVLQKEQFKNTYIFLRGVWKLVYHSSWVNEELGKAYWGIRMLQGLQTAHISKTRANLVFWLCSKISKETRGHWPSFPWKTESCFSRSF